MTTITIDEEVKLPQTHFKTYNQFRKAFDFQEEDFDIDFRLLEEHEITDDLRKKYEESKKLSDEHFTDVTEKYASYFKN